MKIKFELTPLEVSEAQHCFGVRALIARQLATVFAYGHYGRQEGANDTMQWRVGNSEDDRWMKASELEDLFNEAIDSLLDHDLEILTMHITLANGKEIECGDLWADEIWYDKELLKELEETEYAKSFVTPEITEQDKQTVYASVKHNAKLFKGGWVQIEVKDTDTTVIATS